MEEKLCFEDGMRELEQLAIALESGKMTLEESFNAYERAMKLKKQLEKLLDDGDQRIRVLTGAGEEEMSAEEMQ